MADGASLPGAGFDTLSRRRGNSKLTPRAVALCGFPKRAVTMFRVLTCLTAEHELRLVALAGLICFLASFAAVCLLHRAVASQARARWIWIATAGAATGCGIWATHFIAMLAYDPGVVVGYGVVLTILSLVAAIAVTSLGVALAVEGRARWAPPLGGAIVGIGVVCMHYLGMSALELPGRVAWAPDLVAVS